MPKRKYDEPIISPWDKVGITEETIGLAADGLSSSEIAGWINKKYGTAFTRNAVIGKLSRMGLNLAASGPSKFAISGPVASASPPWTTDEIDTMTKLSSFGADALSRLIKRSAKAIYRKASDLGIKLGGPKLARDDKPTQPAFQYVSPFPERPAMTCEPIDGVPLLKATRCQCRAVMGYFEDDYVFCGKTTVSDTSSWCADHHSRYVQTVKSAKEERSLVRAVVYHGARGSQPRAY